MKKMTFGLCAGAALFAVSASAFGAPPVSSKSHAAPAAQARPAKVLANVNTRAEPLTIQRVRYVNGHVEAVGPVMPYRSGGATRTNPQFAWDAYESGTDAATSIPGLPPDGGRYFLQWTATEAYRYGVISNQMVMPAAFNGQMATLVDFTWRAAASQPLLISIFTAEDYNTACTSPSVTNVYDGVQLNFGTANAGFFYTNVDLGAAGLSMQLPMDGTGGFLILLTADAAATVPALDAQMGLWGTGDHQVPVQPRNGTEDASGYADDSNGVTPATNRATNVPNLMLEPTNGECFDWIFGTNPDPDPLCPNIGFGLKMGSNCQADINGDGQVNVQDFLAFLSLFANADAQADINGDNVVNVQDFLAYLQIFSLGC
jgi:hypothetical protein